MDTGKSKSVEIELQEGERDKFNENQETPSSHFQVDADFFDLSDPEKQKDADAEKRIIVECISTRNSEGEEVSNTPEAKNLLKYFDSPKNERKVEDLNLTPGWTKFRFRLCQKACSVPDRGAHVTLLHLVILHQDVVMLQRLIKEITEEDLEEDYLKEKIKARKIRKEFLVEDDRWLFDANCLHLASKYFPEGLNLLLSEDKFKKKAKELIDTKTMVNS